MKLIKCLQICSYLFCLFFLFLCKGATSADLRHEGKVEDLIKLFMLFHKNSAKNINIFLYNFGRDIKNLRCFLFILKLWISVSILAKSISSKSNFIRFLQLFWIGRMLGWSLYINSGPRHYISQDQNLNLD